MSLSRTFLTLAVLSLFTVTSEATCQYFRVNYKFMRCEEYKEKDPTNQDVKEEDPIGAELNEGGLLARATCTCEYSLRGSDPRCDFDQTLEQSSIRGVDSVASYCARGSNLCNEVCARQIP